MLKSRLALMGTVAVILTAGTMAANAATVLRFSDYGPNRGTRAAAVEWFAEQLKERSGGQLEMEFNWGGSLLGGRDTLGGISSGVADIGTVVGFFTPAELQHYNIGDLPVESDMAIGLNAMHELASTSPILQEEFSKAGVRYVTSYTTGPIQLICTREVKTLADLDGLKIRASGPYGDTLERLGAEIVRMSQADVYPSLDSGLIDCNQNYYYAMESYRQYEVAPHVLELDWGQNMSFGIFINEATYDAMSAEEKEVFDSVADDFIGHLAEAMIETDTRAKAAMEAGVDGKSITVTALPEEDRAKLEEASQQAIEDWKARVNSNGGQADELLANYLELVEKHSQ